MWHLTDLSHSQTEPATNDQNGLCQTFSSLLGTSTTIYSLVWSVWNIHMCVWKLSSITAGLMFPPAGHKKRTLTHSTFQIEIIHLWPTQVGYSIQSGNSPTSDASPASWKSRHRIINSSGIIFLRVLIFCLI